jgi:hypothetical protein
MESAEQYALMPVEGHTGMDLVPRDKLAGPGQWEINATPKDVEAFVTRIVERIRAGP